MMWGTWRRGLLTVVALLALAVGVAACGSSDDSAKSAPPEPPLTGAGSKLISPLMAKWAAAYEQDGGKLEYRTTTNELDLSPVASEKTDFGVSDAPITPEQFAEGRGVAMMPWAMTGMAIVYNVKGVPNHLRLDTDTLGGIYLGRVERWNDPAIAALNPGVALPDTPITPVLRRDESGEDYVVTDYLTEYKSIHQEEFGITRRFILLTKHGQATKGNVGGVIARTNGSIGSMPLPYARNQGLDIALLENPAGRFPVPNAKALEAGAKAGMWPGPNTEIWLKEAPASAKNAYPLVTFSYVVVPVSADPPLRRRLKKLVSYAIGPAGQANVEALGFAPLPENIIAANERTMKNIFPAPPPASSSD